LKKLLLKVCNVVTFVVLGVACIFYFILLSLVAGIEYLIVVVSLPFRTFKRGLLAMGRGFFYASTKRIAKMPGMSVKAINEEGNEQVS
jgi:hypothetical protein